MLACSKVAAKEVFFCPLRCWNDKLSGLRNILNLYVHLWPRSETRVSQRASRTESQRVRQFTEVAGYVLVYSNRAKQAVLNLCLDILNKLVSRLQLLEVLLVLIIQLLLVNNHLYLVGTWLQHSVEQVKSALRYRYPACFVTHSLRLHYLGRGAD